MRPGSLVGGDGARVSERSSQPYTRHGVLLDNKVERISAPEGIE